MDNTIIYELAEQNSIMGSFERLVNLYWALSSVLVHEVPGAIVELGCSAGKTSVFFQMLIDHFDESRELHLYDSFQGLPKRGPNDHFLREGDCAATMEQCLGEFEKRNLKRPHIHQGWFDQTFPAFFPERVAFAYLDGDRYDSIAISLQYVYPRLSKNAIVIVDDYCDPEKAPRAWPKLPGVKLACDDFLADKPERMSVLVGSGDLPFATLRKR